MGVKSKKKEKEELLRLYPKCAQYIHLYDSVRDQMVGTFCAIWPWGEKMSKKKDARGNLRNAFDISSVNAKLIVPPIPTMVTKKNGKRWSKQGQTAERLKHNKGLGKKMLKWKWESKKYKLVSL